MVGDSSNAEVVGQGDSGDRSFDAVLDVLANQRRRAALASLVDRAEPIALADLAEEVAVRETEDSVPEIPKADIQEIQLMLHHQHLPKLVAAGPVEYDPERDLVWAVDEADLVERVLSLTAGGEAER